uniref:C2H2-type domain-containing protein n=1 Tax=Panagrellus redivivus TaxID=6233 RepID=A0A7E4VNR1_PANRE
MDLNSPPYDFPYGSEIPQGGPPDGMHLHPHHQVHGHGHHMGMNQGHGGHPHPSQNQHHLQDPYFHDPNHPRHGGHDYGQPRRAISYGGPPPPYLQHHHPQQPQQHHQMHMTQQQQHGHFGDQQMGQRMNHLSPQIPQHHQHPQQQQQQPGHHNQLYHSPRPHHQQQPPPHFDPSSNSYMDTSMPQQPSNNNHLTAPPPPLQPQSTSTAQVSFAQLPPSTRNTSMNNNNPYGPGASGHPVRKFSMQPPPPPSHEYFKSPMNSHHQRQQMNAPSGNPFSSSSTSAPNVQTWRKMSLAPNIRMNATNEPETPSSNRFRSQSTAVLYNRKLSLHRFSSQLRSPRVSMIQNPMMTAYTPPPILSPIRNGSGLFCRIARKPSEYRKRSVAFDMATTNMMDEDEAGVPSSSARDSGISNDDMDQSPCQVTSAEDGAPAPPAPARQHSTPLVRPPIDNRANRPQRKIGLFLSEQEGSSNGFAAELEALRKESAESTASNRSMEKLREANKKRSIQERACSMRASTSAASTNDDVIRKMSTVSMLEEDPIVRKASTVSEAYYDYTPCESDVVPHINLGKTYQARVKKWADREIMPHEREAIADRDECVFDPTVIDHLDERTIAAYESLSCSAAVPKLGRNKELALHILTENKGNIQAAVMDLLRWDTLDWSQYPIIYNYKYDDVDSWTPEEVASFQDAIYKSEKDFHQVALEMNNRDVKQCVEFYYMWKKACPDDYRKLRNLRRKRHLLEQQIDITAIKKEVDHSREESSAEEPESETDSERMDTPIDVVSSSPDDDARPAKMARYSSPLASQPRKTSTVRFSEPEKEHNPSSMYPWLHGGDNGGIFMSPSPSSLSQPMSQSYSQPPSVGNGDSAGHSSNGFNTDILQTKIANIHRVSASKKGAQPSADGYFHCRLCDKRFEKVKSLNAHMKSHAMKARAEAEAQQQLHAQQHPQPSGGVPNANAAIDHARNLAILQHQQQQQQQQQAAQAAANNASLLNNAAQMDALQQQLNRSAASPLELSLQRMSQFASPMGFGANGINFLNPEMLQHLASLPQTNAVVSTAAAIQQSLHTLQQAPIIN